jgi:LysR family cys regulon transcriptional activator
MKDFIELFAPHISEEDYKQQLFSDYLTSLDLIPSPQANTKPSLPMHEMWHI